MKKTYINPNMEVVKIASRMQMLAGSGEETMGNKGDYGTGSGITLGGRQMDFDED